MISVILTGRTLPAHSPETAWAAAARLFKLGPEEFRARVVARSPVSIKHTTDEAEAQRYCTGLLRCGVEAELCEADGSKWEFRQGGRIGGPVPLAYLTRQRPARTDDLPVRRRGELEWIGLTQALRAVEPRTHIPVRTAPARASAPARPHANSSPGAASNEPVSLKSVLAATFVIALYFAVRQQWAEYCAFFVVSLIGIGSHLSGFAMRMPLSACLLVAVLSAYATPVVLAKYGPSVPTCDGASAGTTATLCLKGRVDTAARAADPADGAQLLAKEREANSAWTHQDVEPQPAPDCRHVLDTLDPHYLQCLLLRHGEAR